MSLLNYIKVANLHLMSARVINQSKQESVPNTWMRHPHYNFLCAVDHENGIRTLIWH